MVSGNGREHLGSEQLTGYIGLDYYGSALMVSHGPAAT